MKTILLLAILFKCFPVLFSRAGWDFSRFEVLKNVNYILHLLNTLPYFPSSNHPHTQTPSPIRPWAGEWGWRWLSCGVTGWDFWSLNTVFHQHGAPGPSVGFQSESMSAARGRRISNTWIPFPANNESPVIACSLTGTVWVWCHSTWAHPFFTD